MRDYLNIMVEGCMPDKLKEEVNMLFLNILLNLGCIIVNIVSHFTPT